MNEIQKSYEDGVLLYMKKSVRSLINLLRSNQQGGDLLLIPFLLVLYKKRIISYSTVRGEKQLKIDELMEYYKGADKEMILSVYSNIQSRIEEVPFEIVFEIVKVLDSFDEDLFFENFHLIFADYIDFLRQYMSKIADVPLLPQEIIRVFTGFVPVNMGADIYVPYAGDYSLSVQYLGGTKLISHEPGKLNWTFGMIQYLAYDVDDFNSFKPQEPFKGEELANKKFDLILSAAPFRLKLVDVNRYHVASIEEVVIRESSDLLKENGKLIVWTPPSFLSSESKADTAVREFLITNDYLEKVISFPGGLLPHTIIPFSILVISKQNPNEGRVQFVDAEETVKQVSKRDKQIDVDQFFRLVNSSNERSNVRYIDSEDIADNDFKLNANRYLIQEEDISNTRYEIVPLSFLATPASRNPKIIDKLSGRFIRIRDLKSNLEDYRINLNDIPFEELPKHVYRVDEPSLLLALRFSNLKPSIVTGVHDPYYVSNDILALNVDFSKVDIRYLISELNSSYVETQVAKFRMGATIPYISKKDILQLKVRLLTLEEQKLRVEAELDILDRNKLTPYDDKKKEAEIAVAEQNVFLRHKLAGPAQTLGGSIQKLVELFENKIFLEYPQLKGLKLSDKHLFTLEDYLRVMMKQSDSVISIVSRQLRGEQNIETKKLAPVNMLSFLNQYKQEVEVRPGNSFEIKLQVANDDEADFTEENIYMLANEELLKDMLDNLIENAVVHAFEDGGSNRVEIFLGTNVSDPIDLQVTLLVSNTGKPLSETFTLNDFIRKGFSSGNTGGDGFGGWYINEIVKKFNGRLDYIDETGPEGLPGTDLATSFEMIFPLYINA